MFFTKIKMLFGPVVVAATLGVGFAALGCDSPPTSSPSPVAAPPEPVSATASAPTTAPVEERAGWTAASKPRPPDDFSREKAALELRDLYETRFREIAARLRAQGVPEAELEALEANLSRITDAGVARYRGITQRFAVE